MVHKNIFTFSSEEVLEVFRDAINSNSGKYVDVADEISVEIIDGVAVVTTASKSQSGE